MQSHSDSSSTSSLPSGNSNTSQVSVILSRRTSIAFSILVGASLGVLISEIEIALRRGIFIQRMGLQPYRLFKPSLSGVVMKEGPIPHLRTAVYPQLNKNLLKEYNANPYLRPIFDLSEDRVRRKRLLIASPNLQFIQIGEERNLGIYSSETLLVPAIIAIATKDPYLRRANDPSFTEVLTHELTHACDFVTRQNVSSFDECRMRIYRRLGYKKQFKYSRSDLNMLQLAIDEDLYRLRMGKPTWDLEGISPKLAQDLLYSIESIKTDYHPENFLTELKAYYMEFCHIESFGPDKIKQLLPETSAWFETHFFPKCEEYLRNQKRSRMQRFARGLFGPQWDDNLSASTFSSSRKPTRR